MKVLICLFASLAVAVNAGLGGYLLRGTVVGGFGGDHSGANRYNANTCGSGHGSRKSGSTSVNFGSGLAPVSHSTYTSIGGSNSRYSGSYGRGIGGYSGTLKSVSFGSASRRGGGFGGSSVSAGRSLGGSIGGKGALYSNAAAYDAGAYGGGSLGSVGKAGFVGWTNAWGPEANYE